MSHAVAIPDLNCSSVGSANPRDIHALSMNLRAYAILPRASVLEPKALAICNGTACLIEWVPIGIGRAKDINAFSTENGFDFVVTRARIGKREALVGSPSASVLQKVSSIRCVGR